MKTKLHVTVWNEGRHEKSHKEVADVYPKGIHAVIAEGLGEAGFEVGTTTLDEPEHGIAEGLGEYFEIPHEEMYGERFDIPAPNTLVFVSWFQGGEVFRSGCCYQRGSGKVFYFQPGHETYPTYYQPEVRKVIANAVNWAASNGGKHLYFGNYKPLEKIS